MKTIERGATDVVATVSVPAAVIHGRVLDAAGAPPSRARIEYERTGFQESLRTTAGANGRFRIDSLAAGDYRLVIDARDHPTMSIDVSLRVGEDSDLGDVVLPVPAILEVAVQAADGGTIGGLRLWLSRRVASRTDDAQPWRRVADLHPAEGDAVWRSEAVESGDYCLHVAGTDVAPVVRAVRLVAGAPERIQVSCTRGLEQVVDVALGGDNDDRPRPVRGTAKILDAEGQTLDSRWFEGTASSNERLVGRLQFRLLPGRYDVVVDTTDGGTARSRCDVAAGAPPVRIVLR